jgi:hypothetical protein
VKATPDHETIEPRWLTTRQAAGYICMAPSTLGNWRNLRVGPTYRKGRGGVRYHIAELERYMRRREDTVRARQAGLAQRASIHASSALGTACGRRSS